VFLEKGKYNPSLKLAYNISRVFHLTIEEVFVFDRDKYRAGKGSSFSVQ